MAKKKESLIPTTRSGLRRLLSTPYAYEILIALFVVFGGVANALRGFWPTSDRILFASGVLWGITAIGVLLLSLAKGWVQVRTAMDRRSPHDLEGCLHVLHEILVFDEDPSNRVRLTIHVPVDDHTKLEQVARYVGEPEESGKVGRKWPIGQGLIGRAFRTGLSQVGERTSPHFEEVVQALVSDLGYTEESARQVDRDVRSAMAVPVIYENNVHGILYIDSTEAEFFNGDKDTIIFAACAGIATYIALRYGND